MGGHDRGSRETIRLIELEDVERIRTSHGWQSVTNQVVEYASAVGELVGTIHSAQRALDNMQTVLNTQTVLDGVGARAFVEANAALQKMVIRQPP